MRFTVLRYAARNNYSAHEKLVFTLHSVDNTVTLSDIIVALYALSGSLVYRIVFVVVFCLSSLSHRSQVVCKGIDSETKTNVWIISAFRMV